MHCGLCFSAGGALFTSLPPSRHRSNERSRRLRSGVGFGDVGRSGFIHWVYGTEEPTISRTSQDKFASPKGPEERQGEDSDPSISSLSSITPSQERGGDGESYSHSSPMMGG